MDSDAHDLTGNFLTKMYAEFPAKIIIDFLNPTDFGKRNIAMGTIVFFGARIDHFSAEIRDGIGEIVKCSWNEKIPECHF